MAEWLDTFFCQFDFSVLQGIHQFAVATHGFFNFPMFFVSLFGANGLFFILLGAALLISPRTRRLGAVMLFSIFVGALITNVWLKDAVGRFRPYTSSPVFREWWAFAGAHEESIHSFPSGHTTVTTAALLGLFLGSHLKKRTFPVLFAIPLMGFSRMYLMAHYMTDVIGGLLAGTVGALCGYFTVTAVYRIFQKHDDNRFLAFLLYFSPIAWIKEKVKKQKTSEKV